MEHGLCGTRIYRIWAGMKRRCDSPNQPYYKWYGGRGIKVCDEWKNDVVAFWNWAQENGYADNLTIDRINSNGDYCPENCRWATHKEQANNQRSNRKIEYRGEVKTLQQWVEELGLSIDTVSDRLRYGWSIEDAFDLPKWTFRAGRAKGKMCHTYLHGMCHTPTFHSWNRMKNDCYNSNSPTYKTCGALGIEMCDRWRDSFANFYEDMGEMPKDCRLVRIDESKDFSKDNCKWVAKTEVPKLTANKKRIAKLSKICQFEKLLKLDITNILKAWPNYEQTTDLFKQIGVRVKQIRLEKKLAQTQLCEIAGLTGAIVSYIERGKPDVKTESYIAVLSALFAS